jgi:hypothetical protein
MNKPVIPKLQPTQRHLSENAIRLNQIDAEISRLTKQLEYLKGIRSQYQADAEPVTDASHQNQ